MGTWGKVDDWYHGHIQQIVHTSRDGDCLVFRVDSPEMRMRSMRFARYLGSRCVLELKVAKDF